MKNLKKLPFILAFVCTLFAGACSEIDVTPNGGGEDDDEPIIIVNPPKQSSSSADSVSLG